MKLDTILSAKRFKLANKNIYDKDTFLKLYKYFHSTTPEAASNILNVGLRSKFDTHPEYIITGAKNLRNHIYLGKKPIPVIGKSKLLEINLPDSVFNKIKRVHNPTYIDHYNIFENNSKELIDKYKSKIRDSYLNETLPIIKPNLNDPEDIKNLTSNEAIENVVNKGLKAMRDIYENHSLRNTDTLITKYISPKFIAGSKSFNLDKLKRTELYKNISTKIDDNKYYLIDKNSNKIVKWFSNKDQAINYKLGNDNLSINKGITLKKKLFDYYKNVKL